MSTETGRGYTRRETLKFLGVSALNALVTGAKWGGAGAIAKPAFYSLFKLDQLPLLTSTAQEFVERNGVFIAGEQQFLTQGTQKMKVKVNEKTFADSLRVIAKQEQKEDLLDAFLKHHPLRIALFSQQAVEGAGYQPSWHVKQPFVTVPEQFLRKYESALRTGDEKKIEAADTTLLHELWHVWQDASSNLHILGDAADAGLTVGFAIAGYQLASNLADDENRISKDNKLKRVAIKRIQQTVLTLSSLLLGTALSSQYNPIEWEAYQMESRLVKVPEIAKFRGQYFSFDPISSQNHPGGTRADDP